LQKSDYLLLHVCPSSRPSVCMEQHGSHWTDFHDILYLRIFRKPVEKIQLSLKSDKNNGYFTWRPIYRVLHMKTDIPSTSHEDRYYGYFTWRPIYRVLHMKTDIPCTSHVDQFTFVIISRSFFHRMRNVSDKNCSEIKTHILCSPTRRLQKISPPTGIRSPDRPARNKSLYRLSYPDPRLRKDKSKWSFQYNLPTS